MATKLSVKTKVIDTKTHQMTCAFKGYSGHKGVDLIPASTSETPNILAFADGKVIATGIVSTTNSSTGITGCGTYVAIEHDGGIVTRYQHGKAGSLKVSKGDKVKKGQPIMVYGRPTTGNSSGPHLHFDISFDEKPSVTYLSGSFCGKVRYYVDPLPYLKGTKTIAAADTSKKYVVACKQGLNVRASANGTKVGELAYGDVVTVSEQRNGWAKIGTNKWVYAKYLEEYIYGSIA